MKVVFVEDVAGVAEGGDVKEVKNGFARNYLIPKQLAVPATRDALKRVNRLKGQAETTRLKTLQDMKALSQELDGVQVNVQMRSGASGRLYGSVTNAIVAGQLSEMTGREIDRRTVELPESVRDVGTYDIRVRLHSEVDASVKLLVHPLGTAPDEFLAGLLAAEELAAEEEEKGGPDEPPEAAAPDETASEGDDAPPVEEK